MVASSNAVPGIWFTKKEAAAYLGVTERWLRGATERGDIPYYKFERIVRYHRDDLDAYIGNSRRVGMTR